MDVDARHVERTRPIPRDGSGCRMSGANSGANPGAIPGPEGDAVLVLAIASGRDRAAFVALFDRYAPRLKSWFARGGLAGQQAEDLVQETMLSVWRKADSFDPSRAGVAT